MAHDVVKDETRRGGALVDRSHQRRRHLRSRRRLLLTSWQNNAAEK